MKFEICSKLTIKTPERRHWSRFGVYFVNFNVFHTFFYCFLRWLWTSKCWSGNYPVGCFVIAFRRYLFVQSNNRNIKTVREICLKLTTKTPEWCHWRRSGVIIVNFEQILRIALVFPLLTLNNSCRLGC